MEETWGKPSLTSDEEQQLISSYRIFMEAIFEATNNHVITLLARPLMKLRGLRSWQDDDYSFEESVANEEAILEMLLKLIETRDPDHVRRELRQQMRLPDEAVKSMQEAPVGETVVIPLQLKPPAEDAA